MRVNLPVTSAEYVLPDGEVIVSRTDTKGRITYVNESFIRSSGYSREESMGQPQNFIRHPDMPAEAFADLWVTIKAGKPWSALVKNRRKDGGYYWVKANVTPMVDGGRITGYMSVRTKPSRSEIDGAEALYRKMRDGRLTGAVLQGGELVRTGLLGKLDSMTRIPLLARQCAIYGTLGILYAATAAVAMARGGPGHEMVAALSGLGACLAVGFAVRFAARVAAPLAAAEDIAGRVAGGDLSLWFPHRGDRALVRLFGMLDQMNAKLVGVLKDVSASVTSVQSAASEISKGNGDLSQRTEEQASSLEETASSMEQLTGTVKENAEHSKQANELAAGSSAVALKGGEVVGRVITTMSSINQSSKKIADIIGVIDGIAFQTNILALNAAVEAARAGEQGRGFAVVAAEVRSLAQRSAAAAKEIKELITSSVENVDSGTRLVEQAGGTMDEIVASVKRVTDIIAEISAASHEQSTGIEQVSQAIAQMDQVTQQNAALVEQVAAATESLEGQARVVSDAMGAFNLGINAAAASRATATVTRLRAPGASAVSKAEPASAPRKAGKVANSRAGDDWEQF